MYSATFLLAMLALVSAQDESIDKSLPDVETSLTDQDFKQAKLVKHNKTEKTDDSGMYNPALFEGDIVEDDISSSPGRKRRSVMRNAMRSTSMRWPNGRIPYTISQQYTAQGRAQLAAAIEEYNRLTCIRIVPKTNADVDYVHISPIRGCYSYIGRLGGMQKMSLASGCVHKGTIVHEFMHAVGFFHEQARADRDKYITIYYENILPGLEDQFHKRPLTQIDHLGTQYDYSSVMHYPPTAFSRNGRPTIEPKQAGVTIGQRSGLSQTDAYKINTLYDCSTMVTEGNCEDKSDRCKMISSARLCDSPSLSEYVRKYCARTCNKCCADKYLWCAQAAKQQLCEKSPQVMQQHCPKSCRRC